MTAAVPTLDRIAEGMRQQAYTLETHADRKPQDNRALLRATAMRLEEWAAAIDAARAARDPGPLPGSGQDWATKFGTEPARPFDPTAALAAADFEAVDDCRGDDDPDPAPHGGCLSAEMTEDDREHMAWFTRNRDWLNAGIGAMDRAALAEARGDVLGKAG